VLSKGAPSIVRKGPERGREERGEASRRTITKERHHSAESGAPLFRGLDRCGITVGRKIGKNEKKAKLGVKKDGWLRGTSLLPHVTENEVGVKKRRGAPYPDRLIRKESVIRSYYAGSGRLGKETSIRKNRMGRSGLLS